MNRSPIIALFSYTFLATATLACGNGECEPPVKENPPVVVEPPPPAPPPVVAPVAPAAPGPDGRDPVASTPVIHYGYCCQIDGRMQVSTAWLRDPVKAYEQCRAREERLKSLPECPRWVHRQEGGE